MSGCYSEDVRGKHEYVELGGLVTEHFGIEKLHAVMGWSMGAQQTYEWAVRFPDVVPRAAMFAGTARSRRRWATSACSACAPTTRRRSTR